MTAVADKTKWVTFSDSRTATITPHLLPAHERVQQCKTLKLGDGESCHLFSWILAQNANSVSVHIIGRVHEILKPSTFDVFGGPSYLYVLCEVGVISDTDNSYKMPGLQLTGRHFVVAAEVINDILCQAVTMQN